MFRSSGRISATANAAQTTTGSDGGEGSARTVMEANAGASAWTAGYGGYNNSAGVNRYIDDCSTEAHAPIATVATSKKTFRLSLLSSLTTKRVTSRSSSISSSSSASPTGDWNNELDSDLDSDNSPHSGYGDEDRPVYNGSFMLHHMADDDDDDDQYRLESPLPAVPVKRLVGITRRSYNLEEEWDTAGPSQQHRQLQPKENVLLLHHPLAQVTEESSDIRSSAAAWYKQQPVVDTVGSSGGLEAVTESFEEYQLQSDMSSSEGEQTVLNCNSGGSSTSSSNNNNSIINKSTTSQGSPLMSLATLGQSPPLLPHILPDQTSIQVMINNSRCSSSSGGVQPHREAATTTQSSNPPPLLLRHTTKQTATRQSMKPGGGIMMGHNSSPLSQMVMPTTPPSPPSLAGDSLSYYVDSQDLQFTTTAFTAHHGQSAVHVPVTPTSTTTPLLSRIYGNPSEVSYKYALSTMSITDAVPNPRNSGYSVTSTQTACVPSVQRHAEKEEGGYDDGSSYQTVLPIAAYYLSNPITTPTIGTTGTTTTIPTSTIPTTDNSTLVSVSTVSAATRGGTSGTHCLTNNSHSSTSTNSNSNMRNFGNHHYSHTPLTGVESNEHTSTHTAASALNDSMSSNTFSSHPYLSMQPPPPPSPPPPLPVQLDSIYSVEEIKTKESLIEGRSQESWPTTTTITTTATTTTTNLPSQRLDNLHDTFLSTQTPPPSVLLAQDLPQPMRSTIVTPSRRQSLAVVDSYGATAAHLSLSATESIPSSVAAVAAASSSSSIRPLFPLQASSPLLPRTPISNMVNPAVPSRSSSLRSKQRPQGPPLHPYLITHAFMDSSVSATPELHLHFCTPAAPSPLPLAPVLGPHSPLSPLSLAGPIIDGDDMEDGQENTAVRHDSVSSWETAVEPLAIGTGVIGTGTIGTGTIAAVAAVVMAEEVNHHSDPIGKDSDTFLNPQSEQTEPTAASTTMLSDSAVPQLLGSDSVGAVCRHQKQPLPILQQQQQQHAKALDAFREAGTALSNNVGSDPLVTKTSSSTKRSSISAYAGLGVRMIEDADTRDDNNYNNNNYNNNVISNSASNNSNNRNTLQRSGLEPPRSFNQRYDSLLRIPGDSSSATTTTTTHLNDERELASNKWVQRAKNATNALLSRKSSMNSNSASNSSPSLRPASVMLAPHHHHSSHSTLSKPGHHRALSSGAAALSSPLTLTSQMPSPPSSHQNIYGMASTTTTAAATGGRFQPAIPMQVEMSSSLMLSTAPGEESSAVIMASSSPPPPTAATLPREQWRRLFSSRSLGVTTMGSALLNTFSRRAVQDELEIAAYNGGDPPDSVQWIAVDYEPTHRKWRRAGPLTPTNWNPRDALDQVAIDTRTRLTEESLLQKESRSRYAPAGTVQRSITDPNLSLSSLSRQAEEPNLSSELLQQSTNSSALLSSAKIQAAATAPQWVSPPPPQAAPLPVIRSATAFLTSRAISSPLLPLQPLSSSSPPLSPAFPASPTSTTDTTTILQSDYTAAYLPKAWVVDEIFSSRQLHPAQAGMLLPSSDSLPPHRARTSPHLSKFKRAKSSMHISLGRFSSVRSVSSSSTSIASTHVPPPYPGSVVASSGAAAASSPPSDTLSDRKFLKKTWWKRYNGLETSIGSTTNTGSNGNSPYNNFGGGGDSSDDILSMRSSADSGRSINSATTPTPPVDRYSVLFDPVIAAAVARRSANRASGASFYAAECTVPDVFVTTPTSSEDSAREVYSVSDGQAALQRDLAHRNRGSNSHSIDALSMRPLSRRLSRSQSQEDLWQCRKDQEELGTSNIKSRPSVDSAASCVSISSYQFDFEREGDVDHFDVESLLGMRSVSSSVGSVVEDDGVMSSESGQHGSGSTSALPTLFSRCLGQGFNDPESMAIGMRLDESLLS
ncbi:hypothetical protein BASA62_005767 [Batrachochytrium salamandrivorans]|nr:hypothetical protein BASA62_005767 [Batrachochytrium salamandrivorans]